MSHIERNDPGSPAAIHANAVAFLSGKKAVSRKFIQYALNAQIITTDYVSEMTRIQKSQVRNALLQSLPPKKLEPIVKVIRDRALARCQQTAQNPSLQGLHLF